MDEYQWIYDNIMFEKVNMNEENGEELGVFKNIDCYNYVNECPLKTKHVFVIHDDVLHLARSAAYNIGFVTVIMRSDTNIGNRGRTSYILIGCERSEKYRAYKKYLV
ncbi:hypothetical protein GmHk_16G047370 [Glycine max]|nr:hypothetical protein GmHk_16G047370 [Glycine max]